MAYTPSVEEILNDSIVKFKPKKFVLLVSGGHDSVTNAHVTSIILAKLNIPFVVYHGDTTIGIPETQDYVRMICENFGWKLYIRKPPKKEDYYESLVAKFGFPGPTKQSHQIMYRRLKERALNKFVTHTMKTSPYARENILLATGVRKDESKIRMGYTHTMSKQASKIWVNPIFYWSEKQCERYMLENKIPKNPVKEKICISGECLCGAFAGKEEYAEICNSYPSVGKRLKELHQIAIANGHPWNWSSGPTKWAKDHPKGQLDMFMCYSCANQKTII